MSITLNQEDKGITVNTYEEFKQLFEVQPTKIVKAHYDQFTAQLFTYMGKKKETHGELAEGAARRSMILAEVLAGRGNKHVH